jgi:hypothetical protein
MPHEHQDELRANLLELSEACPFDQTNPGDCPLFPLRKKKPAKRLQWLNALTENDLAYLAAYHRVCLTIKVESELAKLRTQAPGKRRSRREAVQ